MTMATAMIFAMKPIKLLLEYRGNTFRPSVHHISTQGRGKPLPQDTLICMFFYRLLLMVVLTMPPPSGKYHLA
jgi:hypothetical protein